jgi:hypothetical protein
MRSHRTFALAAALGLVLAAAGMRGAAADELIEPRPYPDDAVLFEVGAGTSFPILVGGEFRIRPGIPLWLSVEVGFLPPLYADAIDEFGRGIGSWDEDDGELIRDGLANSFVLSPMIAFAPIPELEIGLGYLFVGAGGSSTRRDLIERFTGVTLVGSDERVPVETSIHALRLNLVFRADLGDGFTLRFGVGWAHTLTTSSRIDKSDKSESERQAEEELDDYINDLLRKYGYAPTVTISLTYRF